MTAASCRLKVKMSRKVTNPADARKAAVASAASCKPPGGSPEVRASGGASAGGGSNGGASAGGVWDVGARDGGVRDGGARDGGARDGGGRYGNDVGGGCDASPLTGWPPRGRRAVVSRAAPHAHERYTAMSTRSRVAALKRFSTATPTPPATIPATDPPTDNFELARTSCSERSTVPGTSAAFVTRYSFEKTRVKNATGNRTSECTQ